MRLIYWLLVCFLRQGLAALSGRGLHLLIQMIMYTCFSVTGSWDSKQNHHAMLHSYSLTCLAQVPSSSQRQRALNRIQLLLGAQQGLDKVRTLLIATVQSTQAIQAALIPLQCLVGDLKWQGASNHSVV